MADVGRRSRGEGSRVEVSAATVSTSKPGSEAQSRGIPMPKQSRCVRLRAL